MKFLFSALAISLVMIACKNSASKTVATAGSSEAATDTASYTTVQWIDSLKDIGPVKFGEVVKIDFKFKNTGTYPLFVLAAEPGCGCTVTDFPKAAIAPGEEGTITAAFDTNKGHEGEFRKNINVTTNTNGHTSQVLYFTGTIVKEGNADSLNKKVGGSLKKPVHNIKAIKIA